MHKTQAIVQFQYLVRFSSFVLFVFFQWFLGKKSVSMLDYQASFKKSTYLNQVLKSSTMLVFISWKFFLRKTLQTVISQKVALNQNLQSKFVLKNAFAQKITVVLGIINMNSWSGFRKSLRGAHTHCTAYL